MAVEYYPTLVNKMKRELMGDVKFTISLILSLKQNSKERYFYWSNWTPLNYYLKIHVTKIGVSLLESVGTYLRNMINRLNTISAVDREQTNEIHSRL